MAIVNGYIILHGEDDFYSPTQGYFTPRVNKGGYVFKLSELADIAKKLKMTRVDFSKLTAQKASYDPSMDQSRRNKKKHGITLAEEYPVPLSTLL